MERPDGLKWEEDMPWIKVIHEDEATGDLAEYYGAVKEQGRRAVNIQKVMSLNPKAMAAIDALQSSWRDAPVLSDRHREMVAVVTSALNRCSY